jgi:hypothetical protein
MNVPAEIFKADVFNPTKWLLYGFSDRNPIHKKEAVFGKRYFLSLWHRMCRIEAQNPRNRLNRRGSGAIGLILNNISHYETPDQI